MDQSTTWQRGNSHIEPFDVLRGIEILALFSYHIALLCAACMLSLQPADGAGKFLGNILRIQEPDGDFPKYWNQVTPENSGKWGLVEPARGRMDWSELDRMYQYAHRHHFPFKQHNFVWGQQQPKWIHGLPPDQQRLEVEKWIFQYGQRYPDTQFIDVVNEALHAAPDYKEALGGDGSTGWDWVIWTFVTARRCCPRAKLLLNDYNILSGGTNLERYIAIIRLLKRRRLIDGIGVQAHGLETVEDATIRSSLHHLAKLKLPIYISELDLDIADDSAQKRRYQSLFPIFWTDPAVAGVTLWGYKQNRTWKPDAYLLRADGSERPALGWLKNYVRSID
jgi:endo-1,4-beta-xylanase